MVAAANMGMLDEMKTLSIQQQPHARIIRDESTCLAPDSSQGAEKMESQIQLPEDILHLIHTLMPMRDAAKAACVSPGFLRSWRCYPKLIINIRALGIRFSEFRKDEVTRDFAERVDHIMHNHSGMGVKTFKLRTYPCSKLDSSCVDRWLQVAIAPGIKEIDLAMPFDSDIKYNFPCSFLSSERISSLQSFRLSECSFHHAAQAGCMNSLTNLDLHSVHITGEELYGFLSNSCALKQIALVSCNDIISLKIPCLLQQLNILDVMDCQKLEIINSNAPNISSFFYAGRPIHTSLGDALQVKHVTIRRYFACDTLYYASTKLPFIVPNVKTLVLSTSGEKVNSPKAFGKFVQLKHLEIMASAHNFSPKYDFFSLISFLDASPALETFILHVAHPTLRNDSIVGDSGGDSLHPWCPSECYHYNLKNVMITGFCSAKSMIELTVHIVEKTKLLECLTLDTTRGHGQGFGTTRCLPMNKEALMEAEKARVAIRRYVEGRVPSSVNLKVIEPCSKCLTYKC